MKRAETEMLEWKRIWPVKGGRARRECRVQNQDRGDEVSVCE